MVQEAIVVRAEDSKVLQRIRFALANPIVFENSIEEIERNRGLTF